MMDTKLKIVTYNCKNVTTNIQFVRDLCQENDIILLQEHWLRKDQLHILQNVHTDFLGYGVSAMDTGKKILKGRPYGGTAIIYSKRFGSNAKFMEYDEDRLTGLEVTIDNRILLILNVYMPTECAKNADKFTILLGKIQSIVEESDYNSVIIGGDFNADPKGLFYNELKNFADQISLQISDTTLLNEEHTFVSLAHGTSSWLDHFICTKEIHNNIKDIEVLHHVIGSDHLPLKISVDVGPLPVLEKFDQSQVFKLDWSRLNNDQITDYTNSTEHFLRQINIPHDLLLCRNPDCKNCEHRNAITRFYDEIVKAIQKSTPRRYLIKSHNVVPGWNDFIKSHHNLARDAYKLWKDNRKPRNGPIFELMKRTRNRFKLELRNARIQKQQIRMEKITTSLLNKDYNRFWIDIKHLNKQHSTLSSVVEGKSGAQNIAKMWKDHFSDILNSVRNDSKKQSIREKIQCIGASEEIKVDPGEIELFIKELPLSKSPGLDEISNEHLKYSSHRITTLLALLFESILIHGFLPQNMIKSAITPIVKDKTEDITKKNNYRPITLTPVILKLLEKVLYTRCADYLFTNSHQFGFKKAHSTELCVFALKEVINFYLSRESNVFMCLLDASKAFDRVNHWTLFDMLTKRGVPLYIIRILSYWYSNQLLCVRWGTELSTFFNMSNGVPQGSIMSPYLFNVYFHSISETLIDSKIGCQIVHNLCNHFLYADDLCLLCPSQKGLQKLIDICVKEGRSLDVKFNPEKSKCIHFKSKSIPIDLPHELKIDGNVIKYSKSEKYLGHIINENLRDDEEMSVQKRKLYSKSNSLIRKFNFCCEQTRSKLFFSYCSNIYLASLWTHFNATSINSFKNAYEYSYKILMNMENHENVLNKFVEMSVPDFKSLTRKCMSNLYVRLHESNNTIITSIFQSDIYYNSKLLNRIRSNCFS